MSELRRERFDVVVDFQGLLQSALVAAWAKADKKVGPAPIAGAGAVRGAVLFDRRADPLGASRGRNLELAAAAGASSVLRVFPLPEGKAGGNSAGGQVRAGVSAGGVGIEAVAARVL